MRLPARGETVYHSLWLPLQEMLSSAELELLFWLDLVQRDPRVKQTDTYTAQQARLDRLASEDDIEAEIARFGRLGALLRTVLNPAREPHAQVRLRLERLMAWGTTTVYPLLLHLLDRRDQGRASSEEIGRAMLYVESFFVRRLVIGRATANINRILLAVVTEWSRACQSTRRSGVISRPAESTTQVTPRFVPARLPFPSISTAGQDRRRWCCAGWMSLMAAKSP